MQQRNRVSPHGEGYVKVYRKLLTSAVFDDPVTLKVWIWCLLRANFQPRPIEFAGEEIALKAGEFITGTFSAADELKLSKSTVWRKLEKLERWGNITLKSGNRFTVISVNKYAEYQNEVFVERETDGKPVGTQRETSGNPAGTDKKERRKEPKEGKKGSGIARPESLAQAVEYFTTMGSPEEVEGWWDHFTGNGWVTGTAKASVRDWKATARTWIRNSKKWGNSGTNSIRVSGGRSPAVSPNKVTPPKGKYDDAATVIDTTGK